MSIPVPTYEKRESLALAMIKKRGPRSWGVRMEEGEEQSSTQQVGRQSWEGAEGAERWPGLQNRLPRVWTGERLPG